MTGTDGHSQDDDQVWDFGGRVALVTGGARGIGEGIAGLLTASGARVVVLDTRDGPAGPHYVHGSVASADDVRAAVDTCVDSYGRLDFAVANAGVVTAAPFLNLGEQEWRDVLGVNLDGCFHTVQQAARVMATIADSARSIVAVSSINAWWAEPRTAHYNASKAGIIGLVRSAAYELAADNIRVNAVCPGMIHTPLTAGMTAPTEANRRYLRNIPLGRMGRPDDIAQATAFLLSPRSSFITGSSLTVDGGQTIGTDFANPPGDPDEPHQHETH